MLTSKLEYTLMCAALLLVSLLIAQMTADLFVLTFCSSFLILLYAAISFLQASKTGRHSRSGSVVVFLEGV